ncbi:MAG TPA: GNAT family N-acetyltransferase [Mycobacteriales bacterium]|nr:GNAT family N-acetyltransferase [Mycobacteriales bacterium]
MSYPQELDTPRLLLRQWRDDDVEPLAEIYADPEVERQLVPTTLEQTRDQVARAREDWAAGRPMWWAVEELATGRFIGRIGLSIASAWELEDSPVEVGWTLARDVWGRGYATEGAAASIAAGFDHLDVDHVISFTRPTNAASRRVMDKLGLTFRGEASYKSIPHVWYSITRAEWAATRPQQ